MPMMAMICLMLDFVELPQFPAAEMQMRPEGQQGRLADLALETMQFVETLLPFLLNERYGFAFFPRHLQSIETQHQFRVQTNVGKGVGDHGLIEVARKVENE